MTVDPLHFDEYMNTTFREASDEAIEPSTPPVDEDLPALSSDDTPGSTS